MTIVDAFARARVAVLDDNRNFQNLMRTLLRQLGFRHVEVFGDPIDALTHVTEVGVDIAFVGLVMPRQNGIEWVRRVRRLVGVANPDMAIVMVSGLAVRAVLEPAVAAGVDGFLVKPLSADTLARHARHALVERDAYVAGADGYWGPDSRKTRLRLHRIERGERRPRPVFVAPPSPPPPDRRPDYALSLPGLDVEIVERTRYHDAMFID